MISQKQQQNQLVKQSHLKNTKMSTYLLSSSILSQKDKQKQKEKQRQRFSRNVSPARNKQITNSLKADVKMTKNTVKQIASSSRNSGDVHLTSKIGNIIKHNNATNQMYSHMCRMQNLLQQYDRQNGYLNKQVLDLLDRKQMLQKQCATKKYENKHKTKQKQAQKQANYLNTNARDKYESRNSYKLLSNKTDTSDKIKIQQYHIIQKQDVTDTDNILNRNHSTNVLRDRKNNNQQIQRQRQMLRQKYGYGSYASIDKINSINNAPLQKHQLDSLKRRKQASSRRKFQYLSPDDQYESTKTKKIIQNSVKPFTTTYQSTNNKISPQPIQKSKRITKFMQTPLQKIKQQQNSQNINNSIRSQLINSTNNNDNINILPVIRRQPYINNKSPQQQERSKNTKNNSPQNRNSSPPLNNSKYFESRLSRQSRRSNKGIQVTLSNRSKNSNRSSPQKQKNQQMQKQLFQKTFALVKTEENKVVESIIKVVQQQPKKQNNEIKIEMEKEKNKEIEKQTLANKNKQQQENRASKIICVPSNKFETSQIKLPSFQTFSKQQLQPYTQNTKNLEYQQFKNTNSIKNQKQVESQYIIKKVHTQIVGSPIRFVTSIGVNTMPNQQQNEQKLKKQAFYSNNEQNKQDKYIFRNRSFSQHRIQPSDKVIYSSNSNISKKQTGHTNYQSASNRDNNIRRNSSQNQIRGKSIENNGKKKFINVISSQLLASRSFHNK